MKRTSQTGCLGTSGSGGGKTAFLLKVMNHSPRILNVGPMIADWLLKDSETFLGKFQQCSEGQRGKGGPQYTTVVL